VTNIFPVQLIKIAHQHRGGKNNPQYSARDQNEFFVFTARSAAQLNGMENSSDDAGLRLNGDENFPYDFIILLKSYFINFHSCSELKRASGGWQNIY